MGEVYWSDAKKIAHEQKGYTEGPNNWTKYAKDLDAISYFNTPKQNVEWCATYVAWVLWKAADPDPKGTALAAQYQPRYDNCGCACRFNAGYYVQAGEYYHEPKEGDVFYIGPRGSESHQGFVLQLNGDGTFISSEGNHGNAVCEVTRRISECSGFGRPWYTDEPDPGPTPPTPGAPYPGPWVSFPIDGRNYIQRYDEGQQVINLQNFLVWLLGPDCLERFGVDGEVGDETLGAVRQAQQFLNDALGCSLDVDGFYGIKTQEQAMRYIK